MNTFDIDSEIDRLVEKFSEELRVRLKKVVARSEKIVLRQSMASQKTTTSNKSVSYTHSSKIRPTRDSKKEL